MMPLIQPLPNPYGTLTEYQKEREHFAELQVGLQKRKSANPLLSSVLSGLREKLRQVFARRLVHRT